MDANEHGRLSNMTLTHKLKQKNNVLVAVLHFTVTVGFIIGINVSLLFYYFINISYKLNTI
jgi:hypothetical protein